MIYYPSYCARHCCYSAVDPVVDVSVFPVLAAVVIPTVDVVPNSIAAIYSVYPVIVVVEPVVVVVIVIVLFPV